MLSPKCPQASRCGMASIENRNGSWRVIFRYKGEKRSFTVGDVDTADAAPDQAPTEELRRLLKRNLIDIPAGCSIEDFMFHRGKPPEQAATVAAERKELTLVELRDVYFESQKKKQEETSLNGIGLHFSHLVRILGGKAVVPLMSRPDLQKFVEKRSREWIDPEQYRRKRQEKVALAKPKRKYVRKNPPPKPPEVPERPKRHPSSATIRKEIISLRTAWNWA